MGFNATRYATLIFEDPDWEGAEVRVKLSAKIGTYLEFKEKRSSGEGDAMETWLGIFEEILVSWNLEDDDGQPIPATPEGIRQAPLDFVDACASAWQLAVGQVSAPLELPSTNGASSEGASMPEDALSPDLSSLSSPN